MRWGRGSARTGWDQRGTVPFDERARRTGPDGAPTSAVGPPATRQVSGPGGRTRVGGRARDVDFGVTGARNLVIGGGVSAFGTVACAAVLVGDGDRPWTWFWQIVFGVVFLWFLSAGRGMLRARGVLVDDSGLYWRSGGAVYPIPWAEIGGVGVGALPWLARRHVARPDQREALEVFPADSAFPARHPELDPWRVEEPSSLPGMPPVRYRFHLPPLSRLPRDLERSVRSACPDAWIGRYRREPARSPDEASAERM